LALDWGATHILIIGGDEVYPDADMIKRMFKWMEAKTLDQWLSRKRVINCLVPIRGHRPGQGTRPFQPIGMRLDEETNELVKITRDDPPIVRAEIIGTGVMLFESDILNYMKKPWFADEFVDGTNDVRIMQDVAFIQKLNNAGHQVWCDTQIRVKHLAVVEADDSFERRFS
jgi:hypothetical protein